MSIEVSGVSSLTDTRSRVSNTMEKMLMEAQTQIRDLLPAREENVRLTTELSLQQDILRSREDEIKKLRTALVEERSARAAFSRKAGDEMNAARQKADAQSQQRLEEIDGLVAQVAQLTSELDRKSRHIQSLEADLTEARTLRAEERTKLHQKDGQLSGVEAERNRAMQQAEELSRANAKLEQARKTLEQELAVCRQEVESLRADGDAQRRGKLAAATQLADLTRERDRLALRVGSLEEEASEMASLRLSVSQLEQWRVECAQLRDAVEKSETAVNNERVARRSAEAERDHLLLKVRGLEMQLRRTEADYHKAQCDAAEGAAIKREADDLRASLRSSDESITMLQSDLTKEKAARSADLQRYEETMTILSREVARLRNVVLSKEVEKSSISPFASDSLMSATIVPASVADASGVVNDHRPTSAPPSSYPYSTVSSLAGSTSRIALPPNPLQPEVNGAASAEHNESRVNASATGEDRRANGLGSRATQESQVAVVLAPLRAAIAEANAQWEKERSRHSSLLAQLEAEQQRNSILEGNDRRAQQALTQRHLEAAALAERETQALRQLRQRDDEALRAVSRAREREIQLWAALGQNGCRADSSELKSFEEFLEELHLVVRQRDISTRQLQEVEGELERFKTVQAELQRAHAQQLNDMELRSKKHILDVSQNCREQLAESARIQSDLSAAVKVAVERFEQLSLEHQDVQQRLQRCLQEGASTEELLQAARQEVEHRRSAVLSLQLKLEQQRSATEAANTMVAELQSGIEHSSREQHESHHRTRRLEAKCRHMLRIIERVGRYCLGQAEAINSLVTERTWAVQYANQLDLCLRSIVAECPELWPRIPSHSVRREPTCTKLLRYSSMRAVVIAVLAALRIQALYFARAARTTKSPSGALHSSTRSNEDRAVAVSGGRRHRIDAENVAVVSGRRVALPLVSDLAEKVLSSLIEQQLESVETPGAAPGHTYHLDARNGGDSRRSGGESNTRGNVQDELLNVSAILNAISSNTQGQLAVRKSFDLAWALASGLAVSRNPSHIGLFGQARLAAAALRHHRKLQSEREAALVLNVDVLQRENTSLVDLVQLKEDQIRSLSNEERRLHAERQELVDKRQHVLLEQSLLDAQAQLDTERRLRQQTEDRLSFVKANEAQLMLRQAELQNEARSLAIELAKKTAVATAVEGRLLSASRLSGAGTSPVRSVNGSPRPAPPFPQSAASTGSREEANQFVAQLAITPGPSVSMAAPRGFAATARPSASATHDVMALIRGIDEKLSSAIRR